MARPRPPRGAARNRRAAAGLALAIVAGVVARPGGQASEADLYVCVEETEADAAVVGATLCTAATTARLTARADPDNLQVRRGARVAAVEAAGLAAVAGLAVGDVIYRVGGADVEDASTATERLAAIGDTADTVVNFLRGGRPYRVKLRR